jgi:hypothetical protein
MNMLTILTTIVLGALGSRAQAAGQVGLNLPIVEAVQQDGPTSTRWLMSKPFDVTTTYADMPDVRGGYGMADGAGYGGDRPDKRAWEGTLTFLPASLHLYVVEGVDGVAAEAQLITFDRNIRACKKAVSWTAESIVFSDVQPMCIAVFVVEYMLADQSAPFIADMINGRQGTTLDLQMWPPEDVEMRIYELGQTWRVFQQRLPISASDLAILKGANMTGMPLNVDRTARQDAPLFTEQTCVPLWGYCGTVPMCCEADAQCVRKNAYYAQCRDATRPIPDAWDDAITV